MWIRSNGQDDGNIPHQGDQVHTQEDAKEERLLSLLLRQSQKEEFRDTECAVSRFHAAGITKEYSGGWSFKTFLALILS